MSKIIAVWGNNFKTSTAINIAKRLALKHKVMLVGTDFTKPLSGIIFPRGKTEQKSLGDLLNQSSVTIDDIYASLFFGKDENLAVVSYLPTENQKTYANYSVRRATNLLNNFKQLVDYVVVDCMNDVTASILSATAISLADSNVLLTTPDVNGVSFYQSQSQLLITLRVTPDSLLKAIAINTPADRSTVGIVRGDIELSQRVIGARHDLRVPFSPKVASQLITGELLNPTGDKQYEKAIKEIIKRTKEA